jgi:hypothetical protein
MSAIGSMRASGVRTLLVSWQQCLHERIVNADKWPGQMRVPTLGSRMACTNCGGGSRRPAELEGIAAAGAEGNRSHTSDGVRGAEAPLVP